MKLTEVRACDNCGQPLAPQGQFYVLRESLAFISPNAFNQVSGLAQMFGGALGLAQVFAPDPEVIKVAGEENPILWKEYLLCSDCYLYKDISLAMLSEKRADRIEREEETVDV